MLAWWGNDFIHFCNDAALEHFGARHAAALGKPAATAIPELWRECGALAESALVRGDGDVVATLPAVASNGAAERPKFTFTLNAIPDDSGRPGGVLWFPRAATSGADGASRRDETAAAASREQALHADIEALCVAACDLAGELDVDALIQRASDAGVQLVGAEFGAFFSHIVGDDGDVIQLSALSGARDAFALFDPRANASLFDPVIRGERVVRIDDSLREDVHRHDELPDDRQIAHGVVRSYVAAPVVARNGVVLGGLYFGHTSPGAFSDLSERVIKALAAQAAVAIDNARLHGGAERDQGERMRAEHALRDSEQRFRMVVQATNDYIWDWDLTTNRVSGEGASGLLGYAPEDIEAEARWGKQRIHEEDRQRVVEGLNNAAAGGVEYWREEFRFRRADGAFAHVLARGHFIRDASGRALRMIGALTDLTDLKRAEEAVRSSERHYRQLVEGLAAAVYTCDADGRIQLYNDAAVALWGQAPEIGKVLYCGSRALFNPDGSPLDLDKCPMAAAIKEGLAIDSAEILVERPDGGRRRVLAHPRPLFDAQGRIRGAVNMLLDVTDRRQAEVAQARLAAIVESSEDAIISITLDGEIVSWNAAAEYAFGYRADEIIGQPVHVLVPADRQQEVHDILARLRRGERLAHFETVRITKSGRRIDISLTVSPVLDWSGAIVGASKIARDVTDRKRAERELAEARIDLALQVKALARLHDLAMQLSGLHAMEPALHAIVSALVELHGAAFGVASLYDPPSDRFRAAASVGFEAQKDVDAAAACAAAASGGTALAAKKRFIVEDVETDARLSKFRQAARGAGFRAIHGIPILTRSKEFLGVLSVYFREPRQPTRRERQLANLCARHAADIVETTRNQQALLESEERFSRFMRHLPGLAWIKDVEGRYVYVNDAAERAFERSRDDLYGRRDRDVFPLETAEQFQANDQRALQAETGVETVETLVHRDGVHHSLVSKFPIPGADGTPVMIGGIAIDVTERLNAEKALRDSEERFRAVMTNAPVAIFIKDLEGRYTLANPLASQALGRPEGAEGLTDHELLPIEVADRLRAVDLEVIASGQPAENEEIVQRDGYFGEFLSVKFPMYDSEGRIVGVGGVGVDVTERKRALRALQVSDQRLRLATQTGKLGVWDWDVENDRISWSESLYAIHGVNPQWFTETVGDFTALVHPDDRALVSRAIQDAMERDSPYELEFRAIRPDGETIWLFTNAVVLRQGDKAVRMLGATMDITERKRGEIALRESEERFRTLANHAPVGIFRAETNGDNVFISDQWCAMAGMPAERALGQGWIDAIHPEDRERIVEGWKGALGAGEPSAAEFRFLRPDGEIIWVQGNAAPLRSDRGELVGYIGTVADITHRKQAEEALRNSERMYRAIGESIDYGIWVCDADGRNIYASESFLQLVGMTQEECSDFGWASVLHPDDVEQTIAAWRQCVRAGLPWDVEHRFRGVDGRWRPVLARGVPVRDDSGEIIAWVGINLDISELKQAENELRESEARFRHMADNAPVLIWINGVGGCQYVNREYLRFIGGVLEDVAGMNWSRFIHPDDRNGYVSAYLEAFERQHPFEAQVRMRRADGQYRWLSCSGAPRLRADGTFLGYVGCSVDVTDIKASEEALREADRRKDDFLAMLGHELRNPLAGIVTGAQVLNMLDLGDDAREMQAVIARQATYMSQIVDDLLDVSRIARGKLTLRRQHVNLDSLVRDTIRDYERAHSMNDCRLTMEPPECAAWVWADPTRITQAVSNIIHNSYKFSDGPNEISVALKVAGEQRQVLIEVTDRGIGMTQETIDRIFEPFNQADTSLDRSRGGLGLGLALAKGLLALHGGSVAASSPGLGQGSTIAIALPLANPPSDAQAAPADHAGRARRVLIIDDRRDAVLPLSKMLLLEGHAVESAMDGAAGVAKAAEFRPDIVLCDIGLAGEMNGYDVSRTLRAMPQFVDTYFVAVTGYGQEDDRRQAKEAGFDYHVTKPLSRDQLLELLDRMPHF